MKENRKTVRVDIQGVCSIIDNEKKASGFLKDISISGIGFFTYDNYELDKDIKVEFNIDESLITLEGRIVFKLSKEGKMIRYGLEIEEISNEDYKTLSGYVTKEIKTMWSNKLKKYSHIK